MVNVSIVSCKNYKQKYVEKAIQQIFKDIKIEKGASVLLKPNLLGTFTNPTILEEICKILKKNTNKIIIGDSSFHNTDKAIEKSGVLEVGEKYGAKVLNFEKDKLIKVKIPEGKILKEVLLPEILFKVDYIINVPKLKTHSLMKLTCAIKNMFGIIPGVKKQQLHFKANTEEKFAQLLLDIYSIVKPNYTIVDAVIGMDGEGPAAGKARPTGLILGSESSFAIDFVACDIMGWKRKYVPTNRLAMKQGLFKDKIKIKGKMHKVPYEKPPGMSARKILGFVSWLIPKPKITIKKDRCIKCHICEKHCPVNAIKLDPYPIIDTKKCIRCFCCIETCPEHALYLKENKIYKLAKWFRKKFVKI
jgi:uncharacterized protein (DUF362 family)/NAD-dependent dihydropyrimidine dehydrogenase PreA subunit